MNFQGTIRNSKSKLDASTFSHRDAWIRRTVGFWVKGGEGKKPFSGSEGPLIDPEQVYVLSPWLLFLFFFFRRFSRPSRIDLQSIVHLSWPAIPHGNWFSFPHIQGPRRSLRGKQEEWGTRTDQFPDASPSFGQFTILTRDRRCLVPRTLRASRTNRKMEQSR